MICPTCNGEKEIVGLFPVYAEGYTGPRSPCFVMPCHRCKGVGEVPDEQGAWIEAGKRMKAERLGRAVGLRAEAERRGMLPSILAQMESGMIEPKP